MHVAPRARHSSHEQAVLVIQHGSARGPRRVDEFLTPVVADDRAARAHVREQVGAQNPVTQPHVGPCPILQARENHDLPVAAHRLRGGEDLDAAGAHAHARNRVDRDRAGKQLGGELHGGTSWVALLPHVRDAQEGHDRVQLIVKPRRGLVRLDRTRAPVLGDAARLPQLPQAFLWARVALSGQLPHARRLRQHTRQGSVVPPAPPRCLGPLLERRLPRVRIIDEVGYRQRDNRGLVARLLGGQGARGIQTAQQPVDRQGVCPDQSRRQEALGQFPANGHVRVTLPRRNSHEVQEKARRGLRREVESTPATGQGNAAARQVAPGFSNHGGAAHNDDLVRKIDAVMQVPGTQGAGDECAHLRGRGTQVRHQSTRGRILGDVRVASRGRPRLRDTRAGLSSQVTHDAGRVIHLTQLSDLDAEGASEPAVQVRLSPTIPSHGHVRIRERDDAGTRVPARGQERQR